MPSQLLQTVFRVSLPFLALATASAHVSYSGRNFGIFTGLTSESTTIANQTIPSNFGWADATDSDFGHSHQVRPFRFTLQTATLITVSVTATSAGLLPAFSLYAGLAHTSPADYDDSPVSLAYLATLSGTYEGAFNALADFKMGNDAGTTLSDLSTFVFKGYAADGTSANFGSSPGVIGDGLADGFVSGTFLLGPGDYSLFMGGANYAGQSPIPDTTLYAMSATVTSQVPEPTAAIILTMGLLTIGSVRQRGNKTSARLL